MNINKYKSSEGIIINHNINDGILLDLNFGKIKYKTNSFKNNICRGAWVSTIFNNNNLAEIKIIKMPYKLSYEDLFFLHHVFEVLNLITAWNNPNPEIKNILTLLYSNKLVGNKKLHMLFIAQLFIILGMSSKIPLNLHIWLIKEPIWDDNYNSSFHLKNIIMFKQLQNWLLETLNEYTDINKLKTLSFLIKV